MQELKIKGIYRHYKGDFYFVEDIIYHSETAEKMVAYRALYGENKLWCRPYEMFLEEVNKMVKNIDLNFKILRVLKRINILIGWINFGIL